MKAMITDQGCHRSASDSEPLSILTVCVQKHYDYIRRQVQLFDHFNADACWQMTVVDNSTTGTSGLILEDRRCKVVGGVPPDLSKSENCRSSYHHAAALNRYVKITQTRFLLILDPDLFVFYRNWIREAIAHMQRNGLSFFGTPWHPRWYSKYRGYPAVHFLLIDLKKVDVGRLDFMPAIVEEPCIGDLLPRQPELVEAAAEAPDLKDGGPKPSFTAARILHALNDHVPLLRSRHRIHSSKDTGWRLWNDFGRTGRHPAGIVLPVLDFKRDLTKPPHLQTPWGRRIERLVPRRWSFFPDPGTYVSAKQAPGFEAPEFKALKPECFVWRGAPFAFHLRRHVRDTVVSGGASADEQALIDVLLDRLIAALSWFSSRRS